MVNKEWLISKLYAQIICAWFNSIKTAGSFTLKKGLPRQTRLMMYGELSNKSSPVVSGSYIPSHPKSIPSHPKSTEDSNK